MKSRVRSLAVCLCLLLFTTAVIQAKQTEKDPKKSVPVKAAVTKTATTKTDNTVNSSPTQRAAQSSPAVSTSSAITPTQLIPAHPTTNAGLTNAASGEQINWQVISGGGVAASSANYIMSGTIGQTAAGPSSSASYALNAGFWQNFASSGGCCIGTRGNVDGDASDVVDISDIIYLVDYSFGGGPAPGCSEEADVNGDGVLDISDLIYLVDYSFSSGAAPVACP